MATTVNQAKTIVAQVAPELSLREQMLVLAIAGFESHYSDWFTFPDGSPTYNWGAITADSSWKGATFQHSDSKPTATGQQTYTGTFRAYPTKAAGAQDLCQLLENQYQPALAAANNNDWSGAAAALFDGGYYAGFGDRTTAINQYTQALQAQLKVLGYPTYEVPATIASAPKPSTHTTQVSDAFGGIVLMLVAFVAWKILRAK